MLLLPRRTFLLSLPAGAVLLRAAGEDGIIDSRYSAREIDLTADPEAQPWKRIEPVLISKDFFGKAIPGAPTEVRSRWTNKNLSLLYVCPYKELTVKAEPPDTTKDTPQLWNWDVAEAFIGWDTQHITQYKEFQVSPRGEFIDLDIDRENPKPNGGADWNSGYTVKARIDEKKKIWYGEMKIPVDQIMPKPAKDGQELRIGLFRCGGAEPNRQYFAWRATNKKSFHVPQAFGKLRFVA